MRPESLDLTPPNYKATLLCREAHGTGSLAVPPAGERRPGQAELIDGQRQQRYEPAGSSTGAQGPARPRLAVIRVRHDHTAVQTDTAEDGGLIAWHHLHERAHTVPLLCHLSSPFFS
ncbi:uncharacterized protein V6R79_016279 [Siganus canaliculatus]